MCVWGGGILFTIHGLSGRLAGDRHRLEVHVSNKTTALQLRGPLKDLLSTILFVYFSLEKKYNFKETEIQEYRFIGLP